MLELKSNYEPIQEATYLRSVSSNRSTSKLAGKNDSFNRILTKANQHSLKQRTPVKIATDNEHNISQMEDNAVTPAGQDQDEKVKTATPGNSDQQKEVSLEQRQPGQSSSEEINPETAQLDQSDENAEANAGLANATPQLLAAAAEVPDSTNSVASKIPTESQMSLSETKPLTKVPDLPVNAAQSAIASTAEDGQEVAVPTAVSTELKFGDQVGEAVLAEVNNDAAGKNVTRNEVPNPQLNELKASEQDLAISKSTIQTQPETNQVNTEQIVSANLAENQTDSAVTSKTADSGAASNTADGVLALVAQAVEITEPAKLTGEKTVDPDLTKPISSSEDEKATISSKKDNSVTSQEDIRFKLIQRTIVNNNKTNQDQPATDIKKLMVAESQRLSAGKAAQEETSLTEAPLANNQSETNQTVTGLEKMLLTSAKAGLDSQTVTTQSAAQTVDQQDIIEQIVQKVELLSKASNTEMKIQLKPEFMGKMIIKIAVEDGLITAKFTTESQQVKHMLEANMNSLKQNLEAQGLKVDRTEVNVQLDNGGSFHGDDSGREQMWQEYAERNNYNRSYYQGGEGYADSAGTAFEPSEEASTVSASPLVGEGKVDFMI